MKKPVVFCAVNKLAVSEEMFSLLNEKTELIYLDKKVSNNELVDMIGDAEGLLMLGHRIDKRLLDAAPKLKAVSTLSVGFDSFDIEEMKRHGVVGLNTPDVLNDTVADLIVALMFGVGRRICELDNMVRQGQWKNRPFYMNFGHELSHKKLGIIGMGRIGETLARKVIAGFNMKVSYFNRTRKKAVEEELGVNYLTKDDLLKDSEYIVVIAPLTEETRGMIGKREFSLMRNDAIFINAGRGPVVDENALIEALQNKQIFGAGLDVFEKEPISEDHLLTKIPNIILLPHIGSITVECREAMARVAVQGLIDYLNGKTPANLIPFFKE